MWFSDSKVVTTNTRQWYAPVYDGHLYKALRDQNVNTNPWRGISTPWGYFNFNAYYSHFTPQAWQRLTNEYKRWRPKRMTVKLYNLQIKQILTLGADTLYNNDLTAGVHIFCDGEHQFPYAQHAWDELVLPELPNQVYKLPQYAYFQYQEDIANSTETSDSGGDSVNAINYTERQIRNAAPLFILEASTHQVLRTGESTQFRFTFDSGWVHNDRAYCAPQQEMNPLVSTRRRFAVYNTTSNSYSFTRYGNYKKPSQWMPGPGMHCNGDTRTANNPNQAKGPIVTMIHPPLTRAPGASIDTTGNNDGAFNFTQELARNSGWSTGPANAANNMQNVITKAYDTPNALTNQAQAAPAAATDVIGPQSDFDMTHWASAYAVRRQTNNTNTQFTSFNPMWMYPMQAWNGQQISRYNAIWCKSPRTDFHTVQDSSDGTLPMSHPPGTIFVKVAKIPIPTTQNTDTYLNLYVTGQVTVTIEWEVERYQTLNWRPEPRTNNNLWENPNLYNFTENGEYTVAEDWSQAMPTRIGMNRVL